MKKRDLVKGVVLLVAVVMVVWGILAIMPSIWFTSMRYNFLLVVVLSFGACMLETFIIMKMNLNSVWNNAFILIISIVLGIAFWAGLALIPMYLWRFLIMQMLIITVYNVRRKSLFMGICLLILALYSWIKGTVYGYHELSGIDMIPVAGLLYYLIGTNFERLIPPALRLDEEEDELTE